MERTVKMRKKTPLVQPVQAIDSSSKFGPFERQWSLFRMARADSTVSGLLAFGPPLLSMVRGPNCQ